MGWIADLLSEIPSAPRYKIQLEQIEAENENLKAVNAALKERITTLGADLDKANEKIRNLNLVIQGPKDKDQKKYDKVTEHIIRYFFDSGRELSINHFISILALNISTIQYYFDLLLKDNLIRRSTMGEKSSWARIDEPDLYSLTPAGREYVIKNMSI